MNEKTLTRISVQTYFWLLFAVQTLLVVFGTELQSPRGIANTVFTYLAFIPFYGYIHDIKFPTKDLWRLFVILFFLWQISAFFIFYDHLIRTKIMLFLLMAPFYWGVALYAVATVEEDSGKKAARVSKTEKFKEQYRSVIAITFCISMTLLVLSLFVMVNGRFNLLSIE
jgi:hypothetical protein